MLALQDILKQNLDRLFTSPTFFLMRPLGVSDTFPIASEWLILTDSFPVLAVLLCMYFSFLEGDLFFATNIRAGNHELGKYILSETVPGGMVCGCCKQRRERYMRGGGERTKGGKHKTKEKKEERAQGKG